MIPIKQIPTIAVEYLKSFYPKVDKIQIEEIEMSDDRLTCDITLSYEDHSNVSGYLMIGGQLKYKRFKIDMKTGEVLAMKIREF